MHRSAERAGSVLSALALLGLGTGCFGSFGLVRKVHQFNQNVNQGKWAQEGVCLLLTFPFLPVYGLAASADAVFFNAVEFWTGEQMIVVDSDKSREARDVQPPPANPTPRALPKPAPKTTPAPAPAKPPKKTPPRR